MPRSRQPPLLLQVILSSGPVSSFHCWFSHAYTTHACTEACTQCLSCDAFYDGGAARVKQRKTRKATAAEASNDDGAMEESEQDADIGTYATSEDEDSDLPELSDEESEHNDVNKNRPSGVGQASFYTPADSYVQAH